MKKVLRIFLILSILILCGCDFVRKVAGRPDSAELAVMAMNQENRRKEIRDSLDAVYKQEVQNELLRMDSLRNAASLVSYGIKSSCSFTFGAPVDTVMFTYNVVMGVFANPDTALKEYGKVKKKGFSPYFIGLPNNVTVLCLGGSDDKDRVVAILKKGVAMKACPSNSWVYVRR